MIQGRGPGTAAVAGHRPLTLLVPSFLRGFERPLVLVRIWNLTRGSPRCFCRERWPQVTPHTVPSARGAQTRGQRVRGRGLRPARAEPAQRWLGAGRGHRTLNPLAPRGGQRGGRARFHETRDAGEAGSGRASVRGPRSRGGVHASPEPEGPSHRWRQLWPGLGTLPPPADGRCAPDTAALPFWGQPCVPAAGPCRGTEVLPSRRLSHSCAAFRRRARPCF